MTFEIITATNQRWLVDVEDEEVLSGAMANGHLIVVRVPGTHFNEGEPVWKVSGFHVTAFREYADG